MTTCAPNCGQCCAVLGIATPPETFAAPEASWRFNAPPELVPVLRHEFLFIRDHWTPVSREQALAINPAMAHPQRAGDHFYTCGVYDPETKRCGAYDDRPRVCRSYPWGTMEPHPLALATFPRCSFWADIPRSIWPPGVDPLPSPENVC